MKIDIGYIVLWSIILVTLCYTSIIFYIRNARLLKRNDDVEDENTRLRTMISYKDRRIKKQADTIIILFKKNNKLSELVKTQENEIKSLNKLI